jgi:hypothetical protein
MTVLENKTIDMSQKNREKKVFFSLSGEEDY